MAKKILIVDDSQVDRNRLSTLLAEAGYEILASANGAEGVESAQQNLPDIILMDVNMPEMDGFAATRALSHNEKTASIPVVLVTAKDQKADKAWGKMLGAKGYITKPFSDVEVLDVVKGL